MGDTFWFPSSYRQQDGFGLSALYEFLLGISCPGSSQIECFSLDSVYHLYIFPVVTLIILETAVFAAPTVILLQIICARRTGRKDLRHRDDI
ncbi:vascular endothelial growth factor receptor 1-like protein [Labeo rohita]|uniref:Vascular endothelial growth factor receptor 1-like protein n=1 Tax=Labeo rohita TaxID=84645 RepID=A0A498MJH0_LABRO|nr:vascular endothelial growth factor receptor 1-like protein [Labeo rohita]